MQLELTCSRPVNADVVNLYETNRCSCERVQCSAHAACYNMQQAPSAAASAEPSPERAASLRSTSLQQIVVHA